MLKFAGLMILSLVLSASPVPDSLVAAAPLPVNKGEAKKNYVDLPVTELQRSIPELNKLEPNADQTKLPGILEKVGANISAFFRTFPDITSDEMIREERLKKDDSVDETATQAFHYLAVPQRDRGIDSLKEYRTDAQNRPIDPVPLKGCMLTKGFTSFAVFFDIPYQNQNRYRYLGSEVWHGREAEVVAFAQQPGIAVPIGTARIENKLAAIYLQGIAWIDPDTDQIVAMRTDLLQPVEEIRLERATTMITFAPVRFKKLKIVLALPHTVTVSAIWADIPFRNTHTYSGYKLFSVQAEGKGIKHETE